MNIFKNSDLKTYDLDTKINNNIKEIKKQYLCKKENKEELVDTSTLKNSINQISSWHIASFDTVANIYNNQKDLLRIVNLDNKILLDIFNMNNLIHILDKTFTKEEQELFINNDAFRRKIMSTALLKIIKDGGAYYGSEYGLIFAKAFNFDYALPMRYASYDSTVTNPRLKEFIFKYLELGGSKQVYWMPNYFANDEKNRYNLEEQENVINIIKCYDAGIYREKTIQKKLTAK